jgi:hypothetical protein
MHTNTLGHNKGGFGPGQRLRRLFDALGGRMMGELTLCRLGECSRIPRDPQLTPRAATSDILALVVPPWQFPAPGPPRSQPGKIAQLVVPLNELAHEAGRRIPEPSGCRRYAPLSALPR